MFLFSLIGVCLIGQAACLLGGPTSYKSYKGLVSMDRISRDQLLKALSVPLDDQTRLFNERGTVASAKFHAAELLSMTSQKSAPSAVLGEFSVDELLSLNKCRLDDCAKTELARRRAVCGRLSAAASQKLAKDARQAEALRTAYANLFDYCDFAVDNCAKFCLSQRERLANRALLDVGHREKHRVKNFRREINERSAKITRRGDVADFKEVIASVLGKKSDAERARLAAACKTLIGVMANIYQFEDDQLFLAKFDRHGWAGAYKFCMVLVEPAKISVWSEKKLLL